MFKKKSITDSFGKREQSLVSEILSMLQFSNPTKQLQALRSLLQTMKTYTDTNFIPLSKLISLIAANILTGDRKDVRALGYRVIAYLYRNKGMKNWPEIKAGILRELSDPDSYDVLISALSVLDTLNYPELVQLVTSKEFFSSISRINTSDDIEILKCNIKISGLIVRTIFHLAGTSGDADFHGYYVAGERSMDDRSDEISSYLDYLRFQENFHDNIEGYFKVSIDAILHKVNVDKANQDSKVRADIAQLIHAKVLNQLLQYRYTEEEYVLEIKYHRFLDISEARCHQKLKDFVEVLPLIAKLVAPLLGDIHFIKKSIHTHSDSVPLRFVYGHCITILLDGIDKESRSNVKVSLSSDSIPRSVLDDIRRSREGEAYISVQQLAEEYVKANLIMLQTTTNLETFSAIAKTIAILLNSKIFLDAQQVR